MENIIILLLTVAVMIGSAISSANKKKKEAARRTSRQNQKDKGLVSRSLSDILEEMENKNRIPRIEVDPEPELDYFEEAIVSLEEEAMNAARLEAMTYNPVARKSIEAPVIDELIELEEKEVLPGSDILEGGFDLRRAVIESEILKPKYEQF